MQALKTVLRTATLAAALAVALPALTPEPAQALPDSCWGFAYDWDQYCHICTVGDCYAWSCMNGGSHHEGNGCT